MNVKNKDIYQVLKKLVRETTKLLNLSLSEELSPNDVSRLVYEKKEKILNMEKYDVACTTIESDPVIVKQIKEGVGTITHHSHFKTEDIIINFIVACIKAFDDFKYSNRTFNGLYKQFDTYFYDDDLHSNAITPVYGLIAPPDNIRIFKNLWLNPLSKNTLDLIENIEGMDIYFCKCVLTSYIKTPKQKLGRPKQRNLKNSPTLIAKNTFTNLLTAFRLLKSKHIHFGRIYIEDAIWKPGMTGIGTKDTHTQPFGGVWEYSISKDELPKLRALYNKLEKESEKNLLKLAIRRFNNCYERDSVEDKIIDSVIALEALLLPNIKDELRYRLRFRGASLLGKNNDDRKSLFKILGKGYDTRSSIVHGTKIDKEIDTEKLAEDLIDIVRKTIKRYLFMKSNWEEMIGSMDKPYLMTNTTKRG